MRVTPKRIYLMTVACSGKSTFAREHPHYLGYKVVDFAEQLPVPTGFARYVTYFARAIPALRRLVKNDLSIRERAADRYYEKLFSYLRNQREPTVVMGRPGPESLEAHRDIAYGAVLIPIERHRANCHNRKRQLRNFLPFLHHPTTDIRTIESFRNHLERYANHHGVPIFTSFAEAIEYLSGRAYGAPSVDMDPVGASSGRPGDSTRGTPKCSPAYEFGVPLALMPTTS